MDQVYQDFGRPPDGLRSGGRRVGIRAGGPLRDPSGLFWRCCGDGSRCPVPSLSGGTSPATSLQGPLRCRKAPSAPLPPSPHLPLQVPRLPWRPRWPSPPRPRPSSSPLRPHSPRTRPRSATPRRSLPQSRRTGRPPRPSGAPGVPRGRVIPASLMDVSNRTRPVCLPPSHIPTPEASTTFGIPLPSMSDPWAPQVAVAQPPPPPPRARRRLGLRLPQQPQPRTAGPHPRRRRWKRPQPRPRPGGPLAGSPPPTPWHGFVTEIG